MITEQHTDPAAGTSTGAGVGGIARLLAAVLVLAGGLVHLQLYFDGYRNIPNANLGRSFVANGVASVLVAIALVLRRDAVVRLAGLGVAVGTLGAFALSRTDRGIFGLAERGLQPSPQAAIALFTELAAVALLAASFVPAIGSGRRVAAPAAIVASATMIAVAVVMTALWARGTDTPAAGAVTEDGAPADAAGVTIVDFAFGPDVLTAPVGSTVTWSNADGFAHAVASADNSFVSEPLDPGDSFQHAFDTAGSFAYICAIHPSMAGTVVVE